jgi:hypothetical protein
MQNTPGPQMGYPPPPRRGVNPWTVVGIGCGGCGIVLIILFAIGGTFLAKIFGKVADEVNKPTVPPPTEYVGVWKDSAGKTLIIGKEGRGTYEEGSKGENGTHVNIDGGRVEIDPTTQKLSVTFAGFGKTFHVDSAPKKDAKTKQMTLDGDEYKRTGDALPDGTGPATTSSSGKEGASEPEKTSEKSSKKTNEKTSGTE